MLFTRWMNRLQLGSLSILDNRCQTIFQYNLIATDSMAHLLGEFEGEAGREPPRGVVIAPNSLVIRYKPPAFEGEVEREAIFDVSRAHFYEEGQLFEAKNVQLDGQVEGAFHALLELFVDGLRCVVEAEPSLDSFMSFPPPREPAPEPEPAPLEDE